MDRTSSAVWHLGCTCLNLTSLGLERVQTFDVVLGRSGHIPCAVSMPYKELIDTKRGGYLPQEQTRAILKAGSALPIEEGRVLLYCNGGVASTAVMFHLWQLGVPLARLSNYDGSIGEWGNQEDEEKFPLISD